MTTNRLADLPSLTTHTSQEATAMQPFQKDDLIVPTTFQDDPTFDPYRVEYAHPDGALCCTRPVDEGSEQRVMTVQLQRDMVLRRRVNQLAPFDWDDVDDMNPIDAAAARVAYLKMLPFSGLSRDSSSDPEMMEMRMLRLLIEEIQELQP